MQQQSLPCHLCPCSQAQPLAGWWLTLICGFPGRSHPFSIYFQTGFALLSSVHGLSLCQAAGWVFLTWPVFPWLLPQPPAPVSCGREISSFLRLQWAKSAEAAEGKQADIFSAVWSSPFKGMEPSAITVQSSQKVTAHHMHKRYRTTFKFLTSPVSNSGHCALV